MIGLRVLRAVKSANLAEGAKLALKYAVSGLKKPIFSGMHLAYIYVTSNLLLS
jgi:hypothetical protein